jgi:hypothetical protein
MLAAGSRGVVLNKLAATVGETSDCRCFSLEVASGPLKKRSSSKNGLLGSARIDDLGRGRAFGLGK